MNGGYAYSHSSMWEQYCQESETAGNSVTFQIYINEWKPHSKMQLK